MRYHELLSLSLSDELLSDAQSFKINWIYILTVLLIYPLKKYFVSPSDTLFGSFRQKSTARFLPSGKKCQGGDDMIQTWILNMAKWNSKPNDKHKPMTWQDVLFLIILQILICILYQKTIKITSPIIHPSLKTSYILETTKKPNPGTAPSFQVFQTLGSPDEPLPAAAGRTTKCFCKLGLGGFGKLGRLQNPVATQILHASPPCFWEGWQKIAVFFFWNLFISIYFHSSKKIKKENVILCCFIVFTLTNWWVANLKENIVTSRVGFVESVEWSWISKVFWWAVPTSVATWSSSMILLHLFIIFSLKFPIK